MMCWRFFAVDVTSADDEIHGCGQIAMAASKTVSMLDSAAPTKAAATNGGASGLVSPGQKLGDSKSYAAGAGTYELDGTIYASLCGIKTLVPATASAATATAAAAAPQKVVSARDRPTDRPTERVRGSESCVRVRV